MNEIQKLVTSKSERKTTRVDRFALEDSMVYKPKLLRNMINTALKKQNRNKKMY